LVTTIQQSNLNLVIQVIKFEVAPVPPESDTDIYYVEKHCNKVGNTSCKNQQMPDEMCEFEFCNAEEIDADRVTESADENPYQSHGWVDFNSGTTAIRNTQPIDT
jgi:hypothetical protein